MRANLIVLETMHSPISNDPRAWYIDELEPVMIYWTRKGRAYPYFTELIFAPGRTHTGRFLCDLYAGYDPATAADWAEWGAYVFREDGMLQAAATIARKYLIPDVGIWIRLPYPLISDHCFDCRRRLRLNNHAVRFTVLSEWIGQVLADWQQHRISDRLKLRGFVWGRESIPAHDVELVRDCNEMLGSLGYDAVWLANYRSLNVAEWKKLGFSTVSIYPNYTGNTEYDAEWLRNTALYAALNHVGIQIEIGRGKLYAPDHFRDYCAFLRQYIKDSGSGSVIYRFPNGSLYDIYRTDKRLYNRIFRSLPRLRGGGSR